MLDQNHLFILTVSNDWPQATITNSKYTFINFQYLWHVCKLSIVETYISKHCEWSRCVLTLYFMLTCLC